MSAKIIDFNKSKQKLLNKLYPNVSPIVPTSKDVNFIKTQESLEKFKKVFFEYQDYLSDTDRKRKIDLDEVLLYFNRFFDDAYIEVSSAYDLKRVKDFKEVLDYSMLSNGKRLRPFLVFIIYNFCLGKDYLTIIPFMVAIELIHTFSLIHDDLPCVDNDELRRGKPTVWKKYGEDMAVLAGDALLMEATTILFELIFELAYTDLSTYAITSAYILFKLAGVDGMIAGQVYDIVSEGNLKLSIDDIVYMYDKKTTGLITASIVVGANMSAKYANRIDLLEKLGIALGEAYQIQDDLLEIESDEEHIGKSIDSDKRNNKMTYAKMVGVAKAKEHLKHLSELCLSIVEEMSSDSNKKETLVLKEVIRYILAREK